MKLRADNRQLSEALSLIIPRAIELTTSRVAQMLEIGSGGKKPDLRATVGSG